MISIAWPWLLILIPLAFLYRWLMPIAPSKGSAALKVPFYHNIALLFSSTAKQRHPGARPKILLAYLIWALLVFAAAGPQWLGSPIQLPQSGRNIMMAIDLSGSMSLPDFNVRGRRTDRLGVVKYVAGQFIKERKGDRVGLILFGSKAYMRTPLTFDLNADYRALMSASIGLAGQQTAIGDAIGLAVKRLRKYPVKSRVLVLLTDGVSNVGSLSPLQAAKLAVQEKIRIYTIGIGANRLVVPGAYGPRMVNPSADLDESSLKKIAKMTGGQFFRATNTQGLEQVYAEINKLEPTSSAKNTIRPRKPLYPWPLGIAFLLTLMIAARKLPLGAIFSASHSKEASQDG